MIDLARYIPALMLAGGAGVAAKGGGDVTKHVLDTVKVVVTRFEMGAVAQALEIDATMGTGLPKDQAGFENYIKENVRSRTGRDPSRDLWKNPYRLVKINKRWTLLSNGPNGQQDKCHDQSADESVAEVQDTVDAEMERAAKLAEAMKLRQEAIDRGEEPPALPDPEADDYEPPKEDDVCVYLLVEGNGKGGGGLGDIMGNQSPYKQIEH
jgi:hypothetical protein